ncbi:MAG: helix-turn-helix domain-containing protein [Desulfovibrio sp.]|nr:helix-turn-helix domain-containing protein [Desulfovibrio sp.]
MEGATYLDIFERLKMASGATSDQELAVKLGLSKQSIADARSRKTVPPAWIPKAALQFGVTTDWLFWGRTPQNTSQEQSGDVDLIRVPMVEARLSAGHGSLLVSGEVERSYAFRSDFLLRKGNPKSMVMMRVSGDSMQPEIMDNDVVLLDQSKTEIKAGRIFAVGFDDAIYCKRIDRVPGKIILKSVNPAYEPLEIDVRGQEADEFRVIGQVIWCGREYPI